MQKNKNRKGLALGAVFALVTSLFASVPSQANESAVVAFPSTGLETQTSILANEAFDLSFRFGNNVGDSLRPNVGANPAGFGVVVAKPAGVTISATVAGSGQATTTTTSNTAGIAATEFTVGFASSGSPVLSIALPDRTSVSAAVAVTVTPFLDLDSDGVRDNGETLGTSITLNFVPWSALGAAVTFNAPLAGNIGVTASVSVAQGSINWAQLNGHFTVGFSGTVEAETNGATYSAGVSATSLTGAQLAAANYSFSARVLTEAASGSPVASYSATLYYAGSAQAANAAAPSAATVLVAAQTVGVVASTFTGLSFSPVVGTNLIRDTHNAAKARPNSAFSFDAFGYTTSKVAGATEVTVTGHSGVEFSATQGVIINGVTYTSSAALTAAKIVGGTSPVSVTTFGQTLANSTSLVFAANAQLKAQATYTVTLVAPTFTAAEANDITIFASTPGAAVTLDVVVKDQYGVVSSRALQRISASANISGSVSAPVTADVVNGKATVAVTPVLGKATGSGTITLAVEHFNADTGLWVAQSNPGTVTVNVDNAAGFSKSPLATASASISYAVATGKYSWSGAITGNTRVAGALVTVTGAGLVLTADNGTTTASGSLTFRTAADGAFSVKVAGAKAGDHDVVFTSGGSSATSVLTIDPAVASAGKTITVTGPTTALPNKTLTYTGSVVDAEGNAVADADVTVTALGPVSLVLGSQAVKTDVDGEFSFRVQTAANDEGDISITATYNKDGSSTLAKDKISAVALTTVAAPVVVTADKVTVAGAATLLTGLSTDVVVTVLDAAGKPLAGRNVSLRSSGPGFLNVQSAVSDTDGKVAVKFIATTQTGEVVITAVVDGKVGSYTLKVEAPVVVVPPAPEVNAVIGTFNGRVAVRVENAKGSAVSVKIGNSWFKYSSLNNNYLWSVVRRVGSTLPVAVYVDGELQNVATITVK